MSLRRKQGEKQEGAEVEPAEVQESRGISGFVSKLRRRAQKREAEFRESHPSPVMRVTKAFASRNGASYAEVADEETKKKSFLRRVSSQWWDRLLGAASERSFAQQAEQYAAHQTKRDYLFNSVGHTIWGFVFPLLTVVVTQLTDVEKGGMFSFAFVVGTLMMIAAQYGVRTYQVSDLKEEHSFADYQLNRIITVIAVFILGLLFVRLRGYEGPMVQILVGVFCYRCIDALADCYEGRLQQMDKMYLAGISQMLRAIGGLVVFTVVLLVSRSVGAASVGMAIAAAATFVFITFPLALLETPKSRTLSFNSIGSLFKQCFPIFVALFLYAVVDNTPKFVMEVTLPYDNQLYFNAMYFPAQAILLIVGLIYKPQLVRMAASWADPENRRRFDTFIVVMLLGVVLITVLMVLFMKYLGIMLLGVLYGVDFEKFRVLCYMMIVAGGMTGGIDFLYQVITIMRRQELVTRSYLVAFAIGVASSILLIHFGQLEGAVTSYVLVMGVLFVTLTWVYIAERINILRHPERDLALLSPAMGEDSTVNAALSGYGTHASAEGASFSGYDTHAPAERAPLAVPSLPQAAEGERTRSMDAAGVAADEPAREKRGIGNDAGLSSAASVMAARSAIIADEISALDAILPSIPKDGGAAAGGPSSHLAHEGVHADGEGGVGVCDGGEGGDGAHADGEDSEGDSAPAESFPDDADLHEEVKRDGDLDD